MLKKGDIGVNVRDSWEECSLCGSISETRRSSYTKYENIPNHIPVEQWERYYDACQKKKRLT
jgi:hypothetical protein